MIRFETDGGRICVAADEPDVRALTSLARQFDELLVARERVPIEERGAMTDPAVSRLLPDPVPTDPAESAEVRMLTEPGLLEHKRANAARIIETLTASGALDERDELAWLQWLTDVRLVLAARLDIVVDGDTGRASTSADRTMQSAYLALGALQADLIDALDARSGLRAKTE